MDLADIKSCFCFHLIHLDVVDAFGYMMPDLILNFLMTAMVFCSVLSAVSCKPIQCAIETMTSVLIKQFDNGCDCDAHLFNLILWSDTHL